MNTKRILTLKEKLINWSRSCHFDMLICVKEVKGKRWMQFLSSLESRFDFDIDTMNQQDSWVKIKDSINLLSKEEALLLDVKRKSKH